MGWFKKSKQANCQHEWHITENLHVTRHHDTPAFVLPHSNESQVSRICRHCLKQECHTVPGHIDYDKALKIFGGKDEK